MKSLERVRRLFVRPPLDDTLLVLGPALIAVGVYQVAPFAAPVFVGLVLWLYGYIIGRVR